jgi:A/G-specific adenine glycosylase
MAKKKSAAQKTIFPYAAKTLLPIAEPILAWFSRQQRALPWRGKGATPYRVWISEIMLQQTQVAQVIPYFERFLTRFPTPLALAVAEESEVLALWAGLGYYSRARLLHRAARSVEGVLPGDAEGWSALPGVGRYTLGAVRSIAYGEPLALVDGNVLRVFARLYALPIRRGDLVAEKQVYLLAQRQLDVEKPNPGDYNQALMELGALVCTPKAPKCLLCPLRAACLAHARGAEEDYPLPKLPPKRRALAMHVAWAEHEGKVLTCLRPSSGLWAGMRVLPAAESPEALAQTCAALTRGKTRLRGVLAEVERALTHRDVTLTLHRVQLSRPRAGDFSLPAALALPSAFSALVDARARDA